MEPARCVAASSPRFAGTHIGRASRRLRSALIARLGEVGFIVPYLRRRDVGRAVRPPSAGRQALVWRELPPDALGAGVVAAFAVRGAHARRVGPTGASPAGSARRP